MAVRVGGGKGMPRRRPLEIEDGPESLTFDRILKPSDADAPGGKQNTFIPNHGEGRFKSIGLAPN